MRCCASSTTSTVPEPQPDPRSFVEATLFAAALKPLAEAMGFMGEVVTGEVAQRLFLPPGPPHGR
jgi:hypothetical protein